MRQLPHLGTVEQGAFCAVSTMKLDKSHRSYYSPTCCIPQMQMKTSKRDSTHPEEMWRMKFVPFHLPRNRVRSLHLAVI